MLLKDGEKLVNAFLKEHFTENQRTPTRRHLLKWSVNMARDSGLFLEFGVWKGDSLKFLAECRPDKRFYGFDTFKGLPEWWSNGYPKGHMKLDHAPYIPGDVILVEGLFQDTLESFLEDHEETVSYLHMDADLYSSTNYVLTKLADAGRIVKGTIIEFDELFYQDTAHTLLDDEHRAYLKFMDDYDVRVTWLYFFQRTRRGRRATTRASLIIKEFNARAIKGIRNTE